MLATAILQATVTAVITRATAATENKDKDYPNKAVVAATARASARARTGASARISASAEDEQKNDDPEAAVVRTRIEHMNFSLLLCYSTYYAAIF